jgi:hypothetical protein
MVSCDAVDHPIKEWLPCVTTWPRDASGAFFDAVRAHYFALCGVNRFHLAILLHRSESVRDALRALSDAGAFATQTGRAGLLGVIEEARDTEWCKREVLDEVERYATYAFVLDGTEVTCGVVGECANGI